MGDKQALGASHVQNSALDLEIKSLTKNDWLLEMFFLLASLWLLEDWKLQNICHICKYILKILTIILNIVVLFKRIWDHIKYSCFTLLSYKSDFLSRFEAMYKNSKINYKFSKNPMKKNIYIILWNVWIHIN